MKPLVSVIVPVYKVEDCLRRCLDSLCRQSLAEIEIIVIDDASPDKCGAICDEYAIRDSRFMVFHNKMNRGLSVSRNIGIAHASCHYLAFVDSDDYVCEDFCKASYECAVHFQADLVMFQSQTLDRRGIVKVAIPNLARGSGYKTKLEALELLYIGVGQTAWNKLYSKELFKNIMFPPGYYFEDVGTIYKTILQAHNIYYFDKVLYYKCYHKGSITTLKTEKYVRDCFEMHLQQYHDLKAWGYPLEKMERFLYNVAFLYCIRRKPDISDSNYVYCANVLRNIKIKLTDLTWKRRILLLSFKHCPSLFELICVLCKWKVC